MSSLDVDTLNDPELSIPITTPLTNIPQLDNKLKISQTLTGKEAEAFDPVISFPELLLVEERLQSTFQNAEILIKDSCLRLLASGGKRIRPLLTLQSAQCFGPLSTATIDAAVAAELIHMASLIHDDVIDMSDLRRGIITINAQEGNHIAVLAGDFIFAEAFRILSQEKLLICMSFLVEAIQAMCNGEIQQARERFNLNVELADYFKRIEKKTGILLASCCCSGAASAGATHEELDIMREYGMNLGYVYQIIDDILDFTGNTQKIGKPAAADLLNGHITLPLIYLLNKPSYASWVKEIIQKEHITSQDIEEIIQGLIASNALNEAFDTALYCAEAAVAALSTLPPTPSKAFLIQLTHKVLHRRK
ncbi:MAG: polyprenyl synthetase family protein [Desulfitobacterium sp.]|nr:polyprenyl synthetase family protein [Desulfitobacterium sp.]